MKKYYYLFIFTAILSFAFFTIFIVFSLVKLPNRQVPEAADRGKVIWQKKGCIECHTIFGNGGYRGPDLTYVYDRRGNTWLSNFFSHPPLLEPAKKKKHPALIGDEQDQIIAYFKFTKGIKNPNWPPKPVKRG